MRTFTNISVVLLTALVAGCSEPATYVIVSLDRGLNTPSEISSIDLQLSLGENATTVTLAEPGGGLLALPTSTLLAIDSGAGALAIVAVARDAAGSQLTKQTASTTVVRGTTSTVAITFGAGTVSDPDVMLAIDPLEHDFGDAVMNSSGGSFTFTIANPGTKSSKPLVTILEGTAASDFVVTSDTCTNHEVSSSEGCTVVVMFKPMSLGSKLAWLTIDDGANSVQATVTGHGAMPGELAIQTGIDGNFGPTSLDTTAVPITFSITNIGNSATGALVTSVTGSHADDFQIGEDTCNTAVLQPSTSCSVTVSFRPSALGARSASLLVSGIPGGSVTTSLDGWGVGAAALQFAGNGGHDFGGVLLGSSSFTTSLQIINGGGSASGVLHTTLGGDVADFNLLDSCEGLTLGINAACEIIVQFVPSTRGAKSLSITVGATPGGPLTTTLTGVGRDSVSLSTSKAGNGAGTVTANGGGDLSSGTGINCGATCSDAYYRVDADPKVTLSASPAPGSTISGWSIAACGTSPTCEVTLSAASTTVTVTFALASYKLTITNTSLAGKTGSITSPEISCNSGTCDATFLYGTSVTLSAAPSATGYFGGWTGDCTGFGACTVLVSGDKSVVGTFTPANLVFTTSTQYTLPQIIALGSGATREAKVLSGADAACASAANGKHSGHFVAWVSGSIGAQARLNASPSGNSKPRGWVRPDGKPFIDVGPTTPDGKAVNYYPASLDELGAAVPLDHTFLSATTYNGAPASWGNCNAWISTASTDNFEVGQVGGIGIRWANGEVLSCNDTTSTFSLTCFQSDYSALVSAPTPPANRRRLFTSSTLWKQNTGLAAADALCGNLAAAQAYPGTYKALIATAGASAASRFTARGVPVVRPDGVVVATTDTAFFGAGFAPAALFTQFETGEFAIQDQVITGGTADPSAAGLAALTCYDGNSGASWTLTSGMMGVAFGGAPGYWFHVYDYPCDPTVASGNIYCLQE